MPDIDLQLFMYEVDLNMKCSIKNPHKISAGPRSVNLGGHIPRAMITERGKRSGYDKTCLLHGLHFFLNTWCVVFH